VTITGLGDFNGKYAYADGSDAAETKHLIAAKSINFSRQEFVCERINNGNVTLNVWKLNSSETNVEEYNGSDSIIFGVYIFDKEKPSGSDYPIAEGILTVAFTNGTASGAFVEIPPYDWDDDEY
jgi:hypothetical protein